MAYTSVKGGVDAIRAAEALVARGLVASERLAPERARATLRLLLDQVMGEGGLYAPELAAIAVAQAEGDPLEAAFLLRAYRSTLPRLGASVPAPRAATRVLRRISSAFKDVPGGQVLGRTRDYTQRLLDLDGAFAAQAVATPLPHAATESPNGAAGRPNGLEASASGRDESPNGNGNGMEEPPAFPTVADALRAEGLLPPTPERDEEPVDITRDPPRYPAPRSARLQALARGETGFMVAMAYSSLRGFGAAHPTIAELRHGEVPLHIRHPLTGGLVTVGRVPVTEVEAVNHAATGVGAGGQAALDRPDDGEGAARFNLGYGAVFGQHERKAIAMAVLDLGLSHPGAGGPPADEEFVLQHCDPVEAVGFVEHLKLPHYVTFQSQLDRLRASGQRRLLTGGGRRR